MSDHRGETGSRGACGGFTVLELAVALALISLAALLAIPAFYGRPEVTLDRAALLLARDLRLAQNDAVHWRRDVLFEFLPEGSGYAARFVDGEALPNPAGKGPFERLYARDAVFEGVVISRLELAAGARSIRFDHLGYAHGGGMIELLFLDHTCQVRVEESSGLVTLHGLYGRND